MLIITNNDRGIKKVFQIIDNYPKLKWIHSSNGPVGNHHGQEGKGQQGVEEG